ncbi:HTH domain-containing protein [Brochothrix thermosphacta]|nr:HTH domain-containing protein [Brochothrix thermosphacta]
MELSKREADIIDMFLIDRNTNTADKIASELKISTKTVYRTIKKINHLVSKELISSEAGKGFSFD